MGATVSGRWPETKIQDVHGIQDQIAPGSEWEFCARVEDVVDWESINGPATRKALPMLLDLDATQRCDNWLWRPLHYAALHGVTGAIHKLVDGGAVIDARTGGHAVAGDFLSRDTFNFCSELECIFMGTPAAVKALELSGDSALVMHKALGSRATLPLDQLRCVAYSNVHYPPHVRHFSYVTPLHIAIEYMHIGVIQALLERGADPNSDWNHGRNFPLQMSIWQGHYKASHILLQHGADANAEDSWGRSPLATAAICPKQTPRFVGIMLLEAGAERLATDNCGKTAAQLARECENEEIATVLESYQLGDSKQDPLAFQPQGRQGSHRFPDGYSDVPTHAPSADDHLMGGFSEAGASSPTPPEQGGDFYFPESVREEHDSLQGFAVPGSLEDPPGAPQLPQLPAAAAGSRNFAQTMPGGHHAFGNRHNEPAASPGPLARQEFISPLQNRHQQMASVPGLCPNGYSPEFSALPHRAEPSPDVSLLPGAEQGPRPSLGERNSFGHATGSNALLPERLPSRGTLPPLQGTQQGSLPPLSGTMPQLPKIPALPKALPHSGPFPLPMPPPAGSNASGIPQSQQGSVGGPPARSSPRPGEPGVTSSARGSAASHARPRDAALPPGGPVSGHSPPGSAREPPARPGEPRTASNARGNAPSQARPNDVDLRPGGLVTDHSPPGSVRGLPMSQSLMDADGGLPSNLSPPATPPQQSPRGSVGAQSAGSVETMLASALEAADNAANAALSMPPESARTIAEPPEGESLHNVLASALGGAESVANAAPSLPPDSARTIAEPPEGESLHNVLASALGGAESVANAAPSLPPDSARTIAEPPEGESLHNVLASALRAGDIAGDAASSMPPGSARTIADPPEGSVYGREECMPPDSARTIADPPEGSEGEELPGCRRRSRSHDSRAEAIQVLLQASHDAPTLADEAMMTPREAQTPPPEAAEPREEGEPPLEDGWPVEEASPLSATLGGTSPLGMTLRRTITPPRPGPFAPGAAERKPSINPDKFCPGQTCPPAMLKAMTESARPVKLSPPAHLGVVDRRTGRSVSPSPASPLRQLAAEGKQLVAERMRARSISPPPPLQELESSRFSASGQLIKVRPSLSPMVTDLAEEAQADDQREEFNPLASTSPALSRIITPPRPGPFAPMALDMSMTGTRRSGFMDTGNPFLGRAPSYAGSIMGADSDSEFGGSPSEAGVGRDAMLRAVDVGSDNESWESV